MAAQSPAQFENVRVQCKANIYFDGKVVSHSIFFADGTKKTIGIIFPGSFEFKTDGAECMEITAGTCRVRIGNEKIWQSFAAGDLFKVAANSSFEIAVDNETVEYVCSFE
ncbi:MAG TPA: pyrimidine/purine nucleoside phosphorylase [Candidatus Acidoferrales bacterium]|nr:pyrimidine/purine nucleoside phosphorylase [Candidatus Acidoferrales bacterium]